MPKDAKKNLDRFKVRGGDINKYDYARNQEQLTKTTKPGTNESNKAQLTKTTSRPDQSRKKAS